MDSMEVRLYLGKRRFKRFESRNGETVKERNGFKDFESPTNCLSSTVGFPILKYEGLLLVVI